MKDHEKGKNMYIRSPIKRCFASLSAALLTLASTTIASAQPASPPDMQTITDGNTPSQSKEPFADWGLPTPPGAEGYQVNQRNLEQDKTLGEPVSQDDNLGDGWQQQSFENGAIYTKNEFPASQATIQGEIWQKWQDIGAQNSALGYPISDEIAVPDSEGKYNVFEGGLLYSHPKHGAHAVIGTILEDWIESGFESGKFGSPSEDAEVTEEGLVYEQKFENETATGYAKVIQDIVNEMPGADGNLPARQVWEDGAEFAKQENIPLADAFSTALKEVREHNSDQESNSFENESGLPDGGDTAPRNPNNRGDIFYSESATFRYNHGHNGIFVGDPNGTLPGKHDTIEAIGSLDLRSKPDDGEPLTREEKLKKEPGVKRFRNYPDGDSRTDDSNLDRLRNLVHLTVETDQATRDRAADWAEGKATETYFESGAGYNYNFAFNRRAGDTYNCPQLVWAAYGDASQGNIDLDSNKGTGVYPQDIRKSELVTPYEPNAKEQ